MPRFQAVPNVVSFPALEHEVLRRWSEEHTFEQSVRAREGSPPYVFYDGPPFATGLPHYGHILTSYIKDVVPRYQTMRGHHVPRVWGWDCHGLPAEYEVEKELGFNSRADILKYGIDNFNDACRSMVLRYANEWRGIVDRMGRWVDFDNAYKTMDPTYMESVAWVFKTLWDRGLVYEGRKVVAYCTRCQTSLSNFEARQDDAFRPRTDPAVTVRFRLKRDSREVLLAWTTTPWTLPSNVALAVGPTIEYVGLRSGEETVWLGHAAAEHFARELKDYVEVGRVSGSDLAGLEYQPLFPYFADTQQAFRVLTADFVNTDEGTGIVHMAPAFGEDDALLCESAGIEGPNPVLDDGTFDTTVPDFAGQHVLAANDAIIRQLKSTGSLFHRQSYEHNYPHCWRCDSPLLYRAIKTWFVRVTAIKQDMVAANRKIRWVPEHLRDGRFGEWLENARDWAVSRSRFWGAPIPVWRCESCTAVQVIGSSQELEAKSGKPVSDWHRPAIDDFTIPCACGGTMRRVPDVLDCWFESGAMPYGQVHYPFERKGEFEGSFPPDFIVEYISQTRGWFYTLVVLAAALFNERPFKNVLVHGVILAADGRKLSKRLKNFPDPMALLEEHGSDALRIALLSSAVVRGNDIRFSGDAVRDSVRRFCIPLWNCLHYFTSYAEIDNFTPTGKFPALTRLDRYLLHETSQLQRNLEEGIEAIDLVGCYSAIEDYIVTLSTWYVRHSRRRIWGAGLTDDKRTALETLYASLSTAAKLLAPFLPFLAEKLHSALGGGRSVHLEDWPASQQDWLNHEVAVEMRDVRRVVRLVRGVREANKISHRQPLRAVWVANVPEQTIANNLDLLREELNVRSIAPLAVIDDFVTRVVKLNYPRIGRRLLDDVKKVAAAVGAGDYVLSGDGSVLRAAGHELDSEDFTFRYVAKQSGTGVAADEQLVVVVDLELDSELVIEKHARDLNRSLQDLRKEAGLAYSDRIVVGIKGPDDLLDTLGPHLPWLAEELLATEILRHPVEESLAATRLEVAGETIEVSLKKANGA